MSISPTALIALICILALIGFSAYSQHRDNKKEPMIVYFTQKLLLLGLSLLILAAVWLGVYSLLESVSIYAVLSAGAVLTIIFLVAAIKQWRRFEGTISKFVKQAYHRN